jgi:hypothetical protein
MLTEGSLIDYCRASDIMDIISVSLYNLRVQNIKYFCIYVYINMTLLQDESLRRTTKSSYRILVTVAILIICVASEFWPVYHIVDSSISHDAQLWIHLTQRLEQETQKYFKNSYSYYWEMYISFYWQLIPYSPACICLSCFIRFG